MSAALLAAARIGQRHGWPKAGRRETQQSQRSYARARDPGGGAGLHQVEGQAGDKAARRRLGHKSTAVGQRIRAARHKLRASFREERGLVTEYPNCEAVDEADVEALRLLSPSNLLIEKREPITGFVEVGNFDAFAVEGRGNRAEIVKGHAHIATTGYRDTRR